MLKNISTNPHSYIKSADHLFNYVNKALRESNCININYPSRAMTDLIYNKGYADKFTWEMRSDITVADARNINSFIESQQKELMVFPDFPITLSAQYAPFSDLFMKYCEYSQGTPGVYSFWEGDICHYVGKSEKLGSRIVSSYAAKYKYYRTKNIFVKTIETSNANAGILELYFIHVLQPTYNKKDKQNDDLTIAINPVIEFSAGIQVLKEQE